MTTPSVAPCELLSWDSQFFGVRIARVTAAKVGAAELQRTVSFAREQAVRCLYLLVSADDRESVRAAETARFDLVDIRVTLDATVPAAPAAIPAGIRAARHDDRERLGAIARVSHRNTRFYVDGRFDRSRCDELYATWILRSLDGELADHVLVSEGERGQDGYVSLRVTPDGVGAIGLIAVAPEGQGRGRGQALIRGAFDWFRARGVSEVTVATQGRNAPSLRFYEQCGFRTRLVQLWYHAWLDTM